MISKCMCSRAAGAMRERSVTLGKSFLDIPQPYRIRPDVRDGGVSELVSHNRGSYYHEKYF